MSREVRRVPVGWQHPVEENPYWLEQSLSRWGREQPASQLRGPTERFIGLMGDYAEALSYWEQEVADIRDRRGSSWKFQIEYHFTGFQGHDDAEPVVHPYYSWDAAGNEVVVPLRDEDHLHELELAKRIAEKPDPADYMPVFSEPEDELGWCLYETVSEGTPVTPGFATAEELIEHLSTVGQDWGQVPMRRTAAEALVSSGSSLGSMIAIGGTLYRSDVDADKIAEATR